MFDKAFFHIFKFSQTTVTVIIYITIINIHLYFFNPLGFRNENIRPNYRV